MLFISQQMIPISNRPLQTARRNRKLAFPEAPKRTIWLVLFRESSCPLSNSTPQDETWRCLSQILENIIASNVDATVNFYLLFPVSRTHRLMPPHVLFRNLVTSLIQHEQVKTTLPKARDAARLAEKVLFPFFLSFFLSFPFSIKILTVKTRKLVVNKGHHIREERHAPSLEKSLLVPPRALSHAQTLRDPRETLRGASRRLHAHTQIRTPPGGQCAPCCA